MEERANPLLLVVRRVVPHPDGPGDDRCTRQRKEDKASVKENKQSEIHSLV